MLFIKKVMYLHDGLQNVSVLHLISENAAQSLLKAAYKTGLYLNHEQYYIFIS